MKRKLKFQGSGSMEDIVLRQADRLLRVAVAAVGNMAEAEDVVQDVFLRMIEKKAKFNDEKHEEAWLVKVTVNTCRNRIRSRWWRREPLLETIPARDNAQREVVDAVMRLSKKYRIAVHLYYFEGYSTREIAEITGHKEATVRQHLTRARRELKKFLEN